MIESTNLINHYWEILRGNWLAIKSQLPTDTNADLTGAIEKHFETIPSDWGPVYEAERLMAHVAPEQFIESGFNTRIIEAEKIGLRTLEGHKKSWKEVPADKTKSPPMKRAIFIGLLEELHWFYVKRRLARRTYRKIATRLCWLGITILALTALPWVLVATSSYLQTTGGPPGSIAANVKHYSIPAISGLFTAISFGFMGAFFSRLNSFQSGSRALSYHDITQIFDLKAISVRLLFGAFGALILYYIIRGGFLAGELFPNFSKLGLDEKQISIFGQSFTASLPTMDSAKLIVWSFLGGFSERLVPSTLDKTATGVTEQDAGT